MRRGFKILIIIVVVLFTVGITAYLLLDYLAQRTIEDQASEQTGVVVTLNSVAIGIFSGRVTLQQLVIGNPPGYGSDNLLVLPTGIAETDLSSLWTNTVRIESLLMQSPVLHVELHQGVPPKSNLGQVIGNIQQNAQQQENQREYLIDYARIENTTVHLISPDGSTSTATLPAIELKNIKSSDGGGVILSEVIGQILTAISDSAVKNTQKEMGKELEQSLQQATEDFKRRLEKELEGIFGEKEKK